MRVLTVIDSFKGSLTSTEAGAAVKEAVLELDSNAQVTVRPIADGGEGTVQAMLTLPGSVRVAATVTGPLGEPVEAEYCVTKDGTAVIETASAAGLTLVPQERRDPELTTTYGLGELIKHAIDGGCRDFVIGLGGSATNDGGIGMLSALGFEFLDRDFKLVDPCARGLGSLADIRKIYALPELAKCRFRIACDVTNPLYGPDGCSEVFAPQKGADPESVRRMDGWMKDYAQLCERRFGADATLPGSGAAGGLGFAFMTFLRAKSERGARLIFKLTELEKYVEEADVIVTGEGRIDRQTVMGKAPFEAAKLAKRKGKPVIAFCGCAGDGAELCNGFFDAIFPIVRGATTLEEAMERDTAYANLKATAYQAFNLIKRIKAVR